MQAVAVAAAFVADATRVRQLVESLRAALVALVAIALFGKQREGAEPAS